MKMNKKISVILAIIALVAVSSISFTGANASVVGQSNMAATPSSALAQRSYIRIDGVISQWGTTSVQGRIQTQAGTSMREDLSTNQLASATAIWTTNTSRPISAVQSKQNFTYTFYEARLRNASVSTLSASSVATNYFLNGTWGVFTVTSNVTIVTNAIGQITRIHRTQDISIQRAYGELNVTDNWSKFTLSINGIDPLTGSVFHSVTRQVQFNPFKVTDDTATNAVTRADVAAVIQSYGAMPGWGNYNAQMDFCGHFKIDIADLSTVASNM
jgi:hypothetical protein